MFIRKNKNRSGSVSVQITQKINRKNKIVKTVGIAKTKCEEDLPILPAKSEIIRHQGMEPLFEEHNDQVVENFVNNVSLIYLSCCAA